MVLAVLMASSWWGVPASAQDCAGATSRYEEANGAPVRDRDLVERLHGQASAACGRPLDRQPTAANVDPIDPVRKSEGASGIGQLIRCGSAGCTTATGARYSALRQGKPVGADGLLCKEVARDAYRC